MSTGSQKRTRQQRVAAVELPPGFWKTLWFHLQRGGVPTPFDRVADAVFNESISAVLPQIISGRESAARSLH